MPESGSVTLVRVNVTLVVSLQIINWCELDVIPVSVGAAVSMVNPFEHAQSEALPAISVPRIQVKNVEPFASAAAEVVAVRVVMPVSMVVLGISAHVVL